MDPGGIGNNGKKLITAREAEAVTEEDIDFHGRNRGIELELSGDVPSLPVPFILTELPREMAFAWRVPAPVIVSPFRVWVPSG